jgi:hypothetical protein
MPPVNVASAVQVIHGPSSGNSNEMSVTVDDKPANIVAAKPGTIFWDVPRNLTPGPHRVQFNPGQGGTPVTLPMYVVGLTMKADQTKLITGQATTVHVSVTGLEKLPASAWALALPPPDLVDLQALQARVPGLKLPSADDPGEVILVLENLTPGVIQLGATNVIVIKLHQTDFASGPYVHNDVIQSLHRGNFSVRGTVAAFLQARPGS